MEWSFALTYAIMNLLQRTIGIRSMLRPKRSASTFALHSETGDHGGGLH